MANNQDDIIGKITGDPVLAQRHHCSGCQRLISQVPSPQLVSIKGKTRGDGTEAKGILCEDCRKNDKISKEGPRQAIYTDAFGEIRIAYYDNLIDMSAAEATTTKEEPTKGATKK